MVQQRPKPEQPSDLCSLYLESTALGFPGLGVISKGKVKNGLLGRAVGRTPLHYAQFSADSIGRGPSPHHRVLRPWLERASRVPSHRLKAPNHTKRLCFTALHFLYLCFVPLLTLCSQYCEMCQTCFTGCILKMTGGRGEDGGDQKGNIHTYGYKVHSTRQTLC